MIQITTPENIFVVCLLTTVEKSFIMDANLRETAQAEAFNYLNLVEKKENDRSKSNFFLGTIL